MSAERATKHYITFVSLVLAFLVILSTEARAELYGFAPISNNSTVSGQMAQQLSLEVTDPGGGQVLFTFYNDGPLSSIYDVPAPMDSSAADVYFDDGALVKLALILDVDNYPAVYPGVDFDQIATPPDLPGGNSIVPPFDVTADFSADAENPAPSNGINPGESLGILFDLASGKTFANVIDALNVGFNPGTYYTGSGLYDGWTELNLRIGVRVINYGEDNEFSDGFILTPIPASVVLGILGLGVVGLKLRKFA
ncbi:MAG: hypothetical protein ACYS19_20430 [Planctomycetota bacterium]|jgi:hypothetical protein